MEVSKTDMVTLRRYLDEASRFYCRHAVTTKEKNRIRLLTKMAMKIGRKINEHEVQP